MPRIVAEALTVLGDAPAVTPWPPLAPLDEVATTIARSLVPELGAPIAAAWLRPIQESTARRLVTVLRRHGAAMLADPVGSGKTFVALAVAAALRGDEPAAVLVPAPLIDQWRRRAAACAVPVELISHVAVSRGQMPEAGTRIVIIDESHHFRHPSTQRYAYLARWLGDRPLLLVTATPVVNRPEDLAHQLLLGARDDALQGNGTPSLRDSLAHGKVPAALGELVVATPAPPGIPGRLEHRRSWSTGAPPLWLDRLDELTLAAEGSTAALIRTVLWSAASSSPAALRATLGRYAHLLRHAIDARRAGVTADRAALRRFAADVPEQLLFWELLPIEQTLTSLPLDDLGRVEALRAMIDLEAVDPKVDALAALLADQVPTLVFATSVATVPYLRDRLAQFAPAWITGASAGWKGIRLPRDRVLDWFGPGAASVTPHILLASDVAAEGLDLQRAARVVHYDLPWTAMRVAQREGRSRRLGAGHVTVDAVRMEPPAWIEERLKVGAILRRKDGLLARTGLTGDGAGWRWRHDVAAEWTDRIGRPGIAGVQGNADLLLVAFAIEEEGSDRTAMTQVVVDANGGWTEDAGSIREILATAAVMPALAPHRIEWAAWWKHCAPIASALSRRGAERGWSASHRAPEARALIARLQILAQQAARARDLAALRAVEATIGFAARGHTAGEELLITELLSAPDAALRCDRPGLRTAETGSGIWRTKVVAAIAVVACAVGA